MTNISASLSRTSMSSRSVPLSVSSDSWGVSITSDNLSKLILSSCIFCQIEDSLRTGCVTYPEIILKAINCPKDKYPSNTNCAPTHRTKSWEIFCNTWLNCWITVPVIVCSNVLDMFD